jgi:uncharacterized membrane protein
MVRFFKTTVLGGVLFLVPIVAFIVIFGKALQITHKIAEPLAELLGVDTIAGIAVVELIGIAILVLICFLAGLAAEWPHVKQWVQALEANVLGKIPAYELLKTKAESALDFENSEEMRTVKVRFDDSWQFAFEMERIEGGDVVIFLPGAPDPWSGSVCVVTEDRITPVDMTVKSTVDLMKRIGKESAEAKVDPKHHA